MFEKEHAYAGCWLEEECFPECVQDDCSVLTKRTAEGINEIALVESTCMAAGETVSFDGAEALAEQHLVCSGEFQFLVDVKRTRGSGIRPLPLRKTTVDGFIPYEEAKKEVTAAPEVRET